MSAKSSLLDRLWYAQKFARVAGIAVSFYLASYVAYLIPNRSLALRFRARNLQLWSFLLVHALGIKVTSRGNFDPAARLIVSNHLSYVDVLLLSAALPVTYVTSQEVFEEPVQGDLCRAAGCLFVERRKKASLAQEIGFLGEMLATGVRLVLFAEGTSSNGESVLKFRSSLLEGITNTPVTLQPLCFNYRSANGAPLKPETRDSLFYYGEMSFFPHLKRLIALRSIEVELNWLTPVASQTAENRKALALILKERISLVYQPVLTPT